jgi:hypothetical protein
MKWLNGKPRLISKAVKQARVLSSRIKGKPGYSIAIGKKIN